MAKNAVIGALRVVLGLDSAAFAEGLTAAQKRMQDVGKRMERVGGTVAKVGAGMAATFTTTMLAAGFAASKAGAESADAMGQVEAALRSMGAASGKTREELAGLATGLMRNSLYDDDEILRKVTANMLTFGKIAGANFDRAQQAAVDLATRMQMDLQPATLLIGKALNDPVKGLTAMGRAGIQFSAAQKETIKSMVATGNAAGAQSIILGELERQFGGAALAAQNTDPYDRLRDSFNDVSESAGGIINRFLVPMFDRVARLLDGFNDLNPEMQQFIVIGAGIVAAIGPALILIGGMASGLGALLPVIVTVGAALTNTFGLALAGLATPIGLVIAAVTALAAAIVYFSSRSTAAATAARELKGIHEAGKTAIDRYREATELAAKATGREKVAAQEAAKAKRQQVFEIIKAAQAKLAEATSTLALVRAEIELRNQKGWDPEAAAGQMAYLGRKEMISEERAKAAAREIQGLMNQLVQIERGVNAKVSPVVEVANAVRDSADAAGRSAKAATPPVRDFKAELKALEQTLMSPEQRAISDRTEQIKLLTDAFEKGAIQAGELARMLRMLDEAQERAAFNDTVAPKPDGNVTLNDGPPDLTSFWGQIMSPDRLEDIKGQFVGFGQDFVQAVRHGRLEDFFGRLGDIVVDKLVGDGMSMLFDMLKNMGGSAGGSGGGWANAIASFFGSVPGFATGGSFKVGGSGGTDSQLVRFRASPNETVDIRRPGQSFGPPPSLHFDMRGAVMTEDLLRQMQQMAGDARQGAVADARQVVPADLQRMQSRRLGGVY